ncbi:hypothetical protein [Ignicoccus hospitalis]|uniref:Uncharacterized protein n=1 Tax=Ignicoccus hospitalis (strain KIN4/I / DSM 18386 / JCM 14125) TaxID=453591 RepID=A8A900_IGNH4|nr:hypothetical protein [Ignicoccus hospitalis]ABU81402.1 hypothetical protein Igni_0218 [Ignicoccus hospitalis KIN4/I]HIH90291.1 hypothetical protein [Desulfurococcaceae archaeon]
MRLVAWSAGLNVERRRVHVALIVKCNGNCNSILSRAFEIFKPIEDKPIFTWSDYFEGFVLSTRFPKPLEEVKAFCESAAGGLIETCDLLVDDRDST